MQIKDLIPQSTLGITLYATNDNIKQFISCLIYNKPIIEQFPNSVLAVSTDEEDISYIQKLLNIYLEDIKIVFLDKNRGHTFGSMDLDEAVFSLSKSYSQKYMVKMSQDTLFTVDFLNTSIQEADFYFLPGFSLETLSRVQLEKPPLSLHTIFNKQFDSKYFTPQSNFFILNKDTPSVYGGVELINEYYTKYQEALKTQPNVKPWIVFKDPKCDNETFLGVNACKNQLNSFNILDSDGMTSLMNSISLYKIGDPSHKNIMLPCGICHFHYTDQPIIKLTTS